MPDNLQILVNTAQSRLENERVTMTVAGTDFDATESSNCWRDPITNTLMMLPVCLDPTFQTTDAGDYARLGLADFGLSDPEFYAKGDTAAGQVRMWAPSGMGSPAISTGSFGVNRGFYLSFQPFNTGIANTDYAFECGWSDGGTGDVGVSIRFYATDGVAEIWKDATKVGVYSFGGALVNRYCEFILLPMRRREILVYCITTGDGFIHVFDDIAEDDATPVITLDESFWFFAPTGAVDCEIAPLRFKASGYVRSKTYSFGKIPQTGQTLGVYVNGDPGATVTNARLFADTGSWDATDEAITAVNVLTVGGAAYTPDGTTSQCIIEVEMSADSAHGYTPFLRGVSASYQATFVDTDDSEQYDITPHILSASLSVPDDPGGVELRIEIADPETVESDVPGIFTQENIPVKVLIGSVVIIDGTLDAVKFTDAYNQESRTGSGVIRDRMKSMQEYTMRDRIPLDGLLLSDMVDADAVGGLYETVGITDYDIENLAYTLPSIPGKDSSEFSHVIEAGTKPFDELNALVTEIAYGFYWGIKPTATGPKAIFKDPDTWTGTSFKVYRTVADAITDGVGSDDAIYRTYDNYKYEALPLAGNELRVIGLDPRKNVPIIRYKEDVSSKDATTAPSSRPDNWIGLPRIVGFSSPRLTTADACVKLIDYAFPRITARNFVASVDAMMLFDDDGVPAWRGDELIIDGGVTIRISAFTAEFHTENDDLVFRSANYVGGASFGLGGDSLTQVRDNFARFWNQGTVRRDYVDPLASALPSSIVAVP